MSFLPRRRVYTYVFLYILFLLSFSLRFYSLPRNLFFGPEQGIDFFAIKQVSEGKFTLIGAKTDINGIFHGPIYYYLSVIPFVFSEGDPVVIAGFFVILNSLTIYIVY